MPNKIPNPDEKSLPGREGSRSRRQCDEQWFRVLQMRLWRPKSKSSISSHSTLAQLHSYTAAATTEPNGNHLDSPPLLPLPPSRPRKSVPRSVEQQDDAGRLNRLVDELLADNASAADYAGLLKSCAEAKAISVGKRIHSLLVSRCLDSDLFLANCLVNMYSKCSRIDDAYLVFASISAKNVVSWNIMVSALIYNKQPRRAIAMFRQMQSEGIKPSTVTFVSVLSACSAAGAFADGRQLHSRITAELGPDLPYVLASALITMYGKSGCVESARQVFDRMNSRNQVAWNVMIGSYAQHGHPQQALELFHQMDIEADEVTLVSALEACSSLGDLGQGTQVHARLPVRLRDSDMVNTALVNMYGKCASLADARRVFDAMKSRDVICWTAMIAAYAQHDRGEEALEVFWRMEQEGVKADDFVFVSVLDACASVGNLRQGKLVHDRLEARGIKPDCFISTTLVNMYRKCGSLDEAWGIFGRLQVKDRVAWNAMLAAFAEKGNCNEALELFRKMDLEGIEPDMVTFNSVLGALTSTPYLDVGRAVHSRSLAAGYDVNTLGVALVKMYGQCRSTDEARAVFEAMTNRDVVAWTALIGAYTLQGNAAEALELYHQMESQAVKANEVTYISLLEACGASEDLKQGKEVHARVVADGYEDLVMVATALVNMYGKCGDLKMARQVFNCIRPRDLVAFTAMISAYVQHGCHEEAIELFFKLEPEGVKPDKVAYTSVIEACANLTALKQGRAVHASIVANGLDRDLGLANSLVNLYGKCGSLDEARSFFASMHTRDVVSWNSIISAYAEHGHEVEVLELFDQMKLDGIHPDNVTFVSILFACSHAGLLRKAYNHFGSISSDYQVELTSEHYSCMIDLLGRSGDLEEAEQLIERMEEPCPIVWMALMAACRTHGDIDRASRAALRVAELDPETTAPDVLLANIIRSRKGAVTLSR